MITIILSFLVLLLAVKCLTQLLNIASVLLSMALELTKLVMYLVLILFIVFLLILTL